MTKEETSLIIAEQNKSTAEILKAIDKIKVDSQELCDIKRENTALKNEVTELKGEAKSVLDNWCRGDDFCPHLKKRDELLTKAREIIRRLMDIINHDLRCFDTMAGLDIRQKAEQFLNDSFKVDG